jgi:hypothetical protein
LVTLAIRFGSIDPPETMRASAAPPAPTITTTMIVSQIQNLFFLRAATATSRGSSRNPQDFSEIARN